MLDWQGEMVERRYRQQVLLSSVNVDVAMVVSLDIGAMEASVIDANLERSHAHSLEPA